MKREDVLRIFPNATSEEVDAVLNGIGAELNPLKQQLRDAEASSAAKDAEHAKELEELQARIEQGMTAEELLRKREEEAAAREREFTLKANALEARSVFVSAGFDEETVEALTAQVVSEDLEATKQRAETIVKLAKAQREAAEEATRRELLKTNPRNVGGGSQDGIGKEQFDKLSYADKLKAIEENPGLLSSFDESKE